MKYLILLRGLPGSGKSYWIKENKLEDYTISSDNVRLLFATPSIPFQACYKDRGISQKNDKEVWDLIHSLVERRLMEGMTTIVDATHLTVKSINYYKSFCANNNVRCIVLDFNVSLESAINNDLLRKGTCHYVGCQIIKIMNDKKEDVPKWVDYTTDKEHVVKLFNDCIDAVDYNEKYDSVVIFGDLHGCYEPLKQWFDKHPVNDKTKYIFCGDYEDRGIQHKELFDFLLEHRKDFNFKFLKGNHSCRLLQIAERDKDSIRYPEYYNTLEQMKDFDPIELKKFVRDQDDMVYFTFRNKNFCVSHGGISCLPTLKLNSSEYIKGHGTYQMSNNVDNDFMFNSSIEGDNIYQVHGHRNVTNSDIQVCDRCFNLEGGVEFGGELRILQIDSEGKCILDSIRNTVFKELTEGSKIVNEFKYSSLIRKSQNPNGISSYNFNRDAFFDKKWNSLTCTARGLFVYDDTDKVAARSFNKFFNLNETSTSKLDYIVKNWCGVTNVYKKENGYLGIISVDVRDNSFILASKSRTDKEFATNISRIFNEKLSEEQQDNLKKWLLKDVDKHQGNAYSLVVEVIDPINDPHFVKYDKDDIVVLDAFVNDFKEKTVSYDELISLHDLTGLTIKEKICETRDLKKTIHELCNTKDHIEGFVLEGHDYNGKTVRVKIKTKWYLMWKKFRSTGDFDERFDIKDFLTVEQQEYAKQIYSRTKQLIDLRNGDTVSTDGSMNVNDKIDNYVMFIYRDLIGDSRINIPKIIQSVENVK